MLRQTLYIYILLSHSVRSCCLLSPHQKDLLRFFPRVYVRNTPQVINYSRTIPLLPKQVTQIVVFKLFSVSPLSSISTPEESFAIFSRVYVQKILPKLSTIPELFPSYQGKVTQIVVFKLFSVSPNFTTPSKYLVLFIFVVQCSVLLATFVYYFVNLHFLLSSLPCYLGNALCR